jgi:hypothetical protein
MYIQSNPFCSFARIVSAIFVKDRILLKQIPRMISSGRIPQWKLQVGIPHEIIQVWIPHYIMLLATPH